MTFRIFGGGGVEFYPDFLLGGRGRGKGWMVYLSNMWKSVQVQATLPIQYLHFTKQYTNCTSCSGIKIFKNQNQKKYAVGFLYLGGPSIKYRSSPLITPEDKSNAERHRKRSRGLCSDWRRGRDQLRRQHQGVTCLPCTGVQWSGIMVQQVSATLEHV